MSSTGFGNMISDRPDLRSVLTQIDQWIDANPSLPIEVARLARRTKQHPAAITEALFLLVERGALTHSFRFETPGGVVLEADYEDISDVPEVLYDVFDNEVMRRDGKVIPVFKVPKAR
jgi:hypothetical protein